MRPFDSRRFFLESVTGAATTRFCVNTAAADAGTSLEINARSSAPVFFRPHAVAAKRNPLGSADCGGACVISRLLPSANEFRDRQSLREPSREKCRLQLSWRQEQPRRSG